MSINLKTDSTTILLFIILLSFTLLISSHGVLAKDLNNTSVNSNESETLETPSLNIYTLDNASLSLDKATYVLNETGSEEFNVSFFDTNDNGILDLVTWNVPQLSNQSFEVEADITILNIQSYPTVSGNWATDLSNWSYRQNYSISNTGENLSYYQVKIEMNSSNVDSNWNWSNNGNDTRFTYYNLSSQTETGIPFWIESWNSTANTSIIWVNVTFVANNTDTTIYMYYGNSNASLASNGTNTFEFFDDFNNIDDWEGVLFYSTGSNHSTISAIDGKLRIVSTGSNRAGACTKINQLSQGQRFEAKAVTRCGSANLIQMLYYGSQDNLYENLPYNGVDYDVWKLVAGTPTHIYEGSGDRVDVTCYPYAEYRTNDYLHFGARSCGEKVNEDSPWDNTNFKLAFYSFLPGTIEIDWVFVRKYASSEPGVSLGGTVISSYTPANQLQIQDERGAIYKQSYPYLQKSRTLNASATLSSTDGVGGVRFIVDQGEAGETIVNDTNTTDTFFSAQFSSLFYGNHTLDITILNTSLVPLSGAGQTKSIDPFWIVPYIIQFIGDSITISFADDTTCNVLSLDDVTGDCNAVTSENSLELPCWDNDAFESYRDYSNGIHIFYSDYVKSIYGTYVFGNNEAQSGITAKGTHDKFIANNNGYADRFTSLDENGSNADLFGPTHAYVMLGLNDKNGRVSDANYEIHLTSVVNDIHDQSISYENITLLYPTYSPSGLDVSNYLDNIDTVASNLGTRLIKDLYNETKDNYENSGKSWYSGDNVHFIRAGSKNISRIIAEQSTWLSTEEAIYTEYSGSETTNFNSLPDITNVSSATLQTNTARITWYSNVNASGANFDTNVDFGFAFVNVNASGLNSTFNSSANLTLYNLPWSEIPAIFEDGSPCRDCQLNYYSGGSLSFNVTHFTNYSAGANANLTIWDDTDPEGGSQMKYPQNQIKFYANYTNKTSGQSINETGVYCNISFNVTPNGSFGMTFNSSSLLYEYNRSFPSSGTFNWNVTGNGSALGYEELNVTDTVTISTSNNYIPPDPTSLANSTGNLWVNHTWSAGSGNVTDSYNVSINSVWHNTTTDTFWNDTYTSHAWQNITVYAYNTSGTGTLSTGNVTQNTQAPSIDWTNWDSHRAVLINNTGGSELNYYQLDVSLGYGINETSLRVVNVTVNTTIPHWCETVIGGNCTKLWFNATHIPANSWCNDTYRIYYGNDTVSSTSDHNATFTKSYNTTGLIIDLHMDEGSGLIAYDATGNHDGELRGGMTTDDWMSYDGGHWDSRTDTVFNGSCIEFDGTDDRVDCGDGSDIPKSGSFTVCCWAKPDVTGRGWTAITDSYDSDKHVTLPIYTTENNTFSFTTASGKWTDLHTDGFSKDIWYFIAATWDVSTHTKRVYLNGLINGTQTPAASGYPYGGCTNFTVGGRRDGTAEFDGWVDEVKVYNRTLSGDEVWRMYIRSKYAPNAPTATIADTLRIPPDPTNLANTTGNFWVNHTWSAGSGNVTDSYNVSMNATWTNDSALTYMNVSVGSGGWANITVWAWNTSGTGTGTGTLSVGCVSDEVQAPEALLTCTCGDICVNGAGWWRGGDNFNSSANPFLAAHNNATSGETICVKDGTYHTSLWISTDSLTFRSENGTTNCIVNATGDYAFAICNDYVNISGFTIENATKSIWWSAGIIIQGSYCNVSYNLVHNNFFGINIDGGDHNLITYNNASYNSQDGIRPYNSANNNEITGNIVNNNTNGIYLYTGCNNSEIINNTANNNSQKGIGLELNCNYNNITNNTVNYNGHHSIFIYNSSSYNNLTCNDASNNTENGIHLELYSQHNTLTENTANNNKYGIYLIDSCIYNNLSENVVKFNSWRGIVLHNSCNHNNIGTNIASNNTHDGIHLENMCCYNNLTINTANSNEKDGIDLEYSDNNTLTGNTVINNTFDGIILYNSINNTITASTVSDNQLHGIQLILSNNTNVSYNTIYNNYFNNTYNAWDNGNNIWNTTPTPGTNIIGGSWLGGNYWSDYAGNDTNDDGLGDTILPYNSNITNGGDYHPLITSGFTAPCILSSVPASSAAADTVGTARTFSITIDKTVNVTWYINGILMQTNDSVSTALYANPNIVAGYWNVTAVASNIIDRDIRTWWWCGCQRA